MFIDRSNYDLRDRIDLEIFDRFRSRTAMHPSKAAWNLSATNHIISALFSVILLIILAPLLMTIALAIKYTSSGPIIFKQTRTGYLGRRFTLYKFRTMVEDAEQLKHQLTHLNHQNADSPDFKIRRDPRVTDIGRFLRKYSLDELPQLWNIIKGDMRLVGPRPTSFAADTYENHHLIRLAVPPGLTGLWQISGRSDVDFEQRVQLDYQYICNQGPLQDLTILLKTPMAVIRSVGAY